jgi:hypothetical protein
MPNRFDKIINTDLHQANLDALNGASFLLPENEHSAFRTGTRNKIMRRAGYKCELTGISELPLQAAHLDHTKGTSYYNSPSNGLMVSDIMHLTHHFMYIPNPEEIGLNFRANNWAVDMQFRNVAKRKTIAGEWDRSVFELEGVEFLQFLADELYLYRKLWENWYEMNYVEG